MFRNNLPFKKLKSFVYHQYEWSFYQIVWGSNPDCIKQLFAESIAFQYKVNRFSILASVKSGTRPGNWFIHSDVSAKFSFRNTWHSKSAMKTIFRNFFFLLPDDEMWMISKWIWHFAHLQFTFNGTFWMPDISQWEYSLSYHDIYHVNSSSGWP